MTIRSIGDCIARKVVIVTVSVIGGLLLSPTGVRAACDVIPAKAPAIRATNVTVDRPFGGPGEFVTIGPEARCAAVPSFSARAGAQVVSVVFTPPSATPHLVVLAGDCRNITACSSVPTTCIAANGNDVEVLDASHLRFRFPDTDALVGGRSDAITLAGPATIAITRATDPLPCALATHSCSDEIGALSLLACVDTLFADDGTCSANADSTFPHFTALPPATDYQALCTDPTSVCTGSRQEVRFAVDAAGNLLIPMDWRGVLINGDVPVPRLLRATTSLDAFAGTGVPMRIPPSFLSSFSREGRKLPPIFDPQVDQQDPQHLMTLFGSADAPATVLRIARRGAVLACLGGTNDGGSCTTIADCADGLCTPAFRTCAHDGTENDGRPCTEDRDCGAAPARCAEATCTGGANANDPCRRDRDCPGGTCGPALFDFADRTLDGIGPVVVRTGQCAAGSGSVQCADLRAKALDPVPLDGLVQSGAANALVRSETLSAADINGDGDTTDDVVTFDDRATGDPQSIGEGATRGRAVVRVQQSRFTFPAVAADGDVLAFLEPEARQYDRDHDGDGDAADTVLRVYRLGRGSILGDAIAADAAPVVNERSIVLEGGSLFFRSHEGDAVRRRTEPVTSPFPGDVSYLPSISARGRFVVFSSFNERLPGASIFPTLEVYAWDRCIDRNAKVPGCTPHFELVSVDGEGFGGSGWSGFGISSPSADGAAIAFTSDAPLAAADTNGASDMYVRNRCPGSASSPSCGTTDLVSVNDAGVVGDKASFYDPTISADGRFIAFESGATNLVGGDTNFTENVYLRDRCVADGRPVPGCTIHTERASVDDGTFPGRTGYRPALSGDGRFVAYSSAPNTSIASSSGPYVGPSWSSSQVHVRDRCSGSAGVAPGCSPATEVVSVDSRGMPGDNQSDWPALSADGRFVAFQSFATNLVPGDTNGQPDVFVHDRTTGVTKRVSVDSAGHEADGGSGGPAISGDGRYVAFVSTATNLVAGDLNTCTYSDPNATIPGTCADVFVHDRVTGVTERVSVATAGTEANGQSNYSGGGGLYYPPGLSSDGRTVAFSSNASNLVPGDTNTCSVFTTPGTCEDVFARAPDATATTADVNGDGDLDDTFLEVFDVDSGIVTPICPASLVAVAPAPVTGPPIVAFLEPESSRPATRRCANGDLNRDGDTNDEVAKVWHGIRAPIVNLERAAVAVAASSQWIAALVSEAHQQNLDLNGDGDTDDAVVEVVPASATDASGWIDVGQAADRIAVAGTTIAFLTPEAQQRQDLNGDHDTNDRVIQVYDAARGRLLATPRQAAEDFVLGDSGLLAFRTNEHAQGDADLNGDGDTDDDVLQVFDPATGRVLDTRQAVTPCTFEACDPHVPYRVLDNTVTFLTFECDQGGPVVDAGCPTGGTDLNGNGTADDLVLQTFNVRMAAAFAPGPRSLVRRDVGGPANVTTLAATSAGVCTTTGHACARDADCAPGTCFIPPGGCVLALGSCNPTLARPCGDGQFCRPKLGFPGEGDCEQVVGTCSSNADCAPPATCTTGDRTLIRLVGPLARRNGGTTVFTGFGRCVESSHTRCASAEACAAGQVCVDGACRREHGLCRQNDDCPAAAFCEKKLVTHALEDADGDEIPDVFDNCPTVANPDQADGDDPPDGVGDACDAKAVTIGSSTTATESTTTSTIGSSTTATEGTTTSTIGSSTTATESTTTSTTGSSTTTAASTTTSTTLPGCPAGPAPAAAECSLGRLLVSVDERSDLGRLHGEFASKLRRVRTRLSAAVALLDRGYTRRGRIALRQVAKRLATFERRVRVLSGRHVIPSGTAAMLYDLAQKALIKVAELRTSIVR